ncbi:MAG: glycosyltransferase family 4 protein [Euryarchaeota archaeon]|nr:glycosyltransferase family 4 protein [Euryarchaeota archaeon]
MKLKVAVNTQTPLVRFHLSYAELLEKYGELPDTLPLRLLSPDEDYTFTPGGVTRMVYDLLGAFRRRGALRRAHWVSLNPAAPERVTLPGLTLHNVSLEPHELGVYAHLKEGLWSEVHGLGKHAIGPQQFRAYARYNWLSAERILGLPVDVAYIHDYHQLQVGSMVGPSIPAVFRWHVPFHPEWMHQYTRNFIVRAMEGFDGVVVSCRRDLEGLIRVGYRGQAYQMYPYVDHRRWTPARPRDLGALEERFHIREEDRVVLVVARMDPIKGHDTALEALARLRDPRVRLFLVGNGSFTSSQGGLGHPKGSTWLGHLQRRARALRVQDRTVFTGYLPDPILRALYQRCDAFVLPSRVEGFGLAAVEAWLYRKPVLVSRGAGISELINEGTNGHTFRPGSGAELAAKLKRVLRGDERARRMGERGRETTRQCDADHAAIRVATILEEAVAGYRR